MDVCFCDVVDDSFPSAGRSATSFFHDLELHGIDLGATPAIAAAVAAVSRKAANRAAARRSRDRVRKRKAVLETQLQHLSQRVEVLQSENEGMRAFLHEHRDDGAAADV